MKINTDALLNDARDLFARQGKPPAHRTLSDGECALEEPGPGPLPETPRKDEGGKKGLLSRVRGLVGRTGRRAKGVRCDSWDGKGGETAIYAAVSAGMSDDMCNDLSRIDPLAGIAEEILQENQPTPDEGAEGVVESYWLNPPFAYATIVLNDNRDYVYEIHEPALTEREIIVLEETDGQLRNILVFDSPQKQASLDIDPGLVRKIIRKFDPAIPDDRIEILQYYLHRNFQGYGKLDPLMYDEFIEDITCNGAGIPIYLYHRRYTNLPTNLAFEGTELNKFVLKLAQKADKQLSLTTPLVDAALPGGARAQITYSDIVSSKGSSFTIRRFKSEPMTPVDLIQLETFDTAIMALIWLAVENRKSMIIVGGTASGKTSTMNAISLFIPPCAKIVSLEDTREIQMPHENWLPMKTRESNAVSDRGDVDLFALLRASLRQRPEYIIVGEVRGREAQTLFQAMNTGHTTYSTLHAGSVEQAINRLTNEPINVPHAMFGALDLMLIQSLQYKDGKAIRRCISLNEIVADKDTITWSQLYAWDPRTDTFEKTHERSALLESIAYSHGWTAGDLDYNLEVRSEILEMMAANNVRKGEQITHIIDQLRKRDNDEIYQ
jgi:flagellar protein FlaI